MGEEKKGQKIGRREERGICDLKGVKQRDKRREW